MRRIAPIVLLGVLTLGGVPGAVAEKDAPTPDSYTVKRLFLVPARATGQPVVAELVLTRRTDVLEKEPTGGDRAAAQAALAEVLAGTQGVAECVGMTMERAHEVVAEQACAGDVVMRHPADRIGEMLSGPDLSGLGEGIDSQDDDWFRPDVDMDDCEECTEEDREEARRLQELEAAWNDAKSRYSDHMKDLQDEPRGRKPGESHEEWKRRIKAALDEQKRLEEERAKAKAAYEEAKRKAKEERERQERQQQEDCEEGEEGCEPEEDDDDTPDETPGPDQHTGASAECKEAVKRRLADLHVPGNVDPSPVDPPRGSKGAAVYACLVEAQVIQNCELDTVTTPRPDDPRSSQCEPPAGQLPFSVLSKQELWTDPSPIGEAGGGPRSPSAPGRPGGPPVTPTGPVGPEPAPPAGATGLQPTHLDRQARRLLDEVLAVSDLRLLVYGY